jgi:hypothetical protein
MSQNFTCLVDNDERRRASTSNLHKLANAENGILWWRSLPMVCQGRVCPALGCEESIGDHHRSSLTMKLNLRLNLRLTYQTHLDEISTYCSPTVEKKWIGRCD